jgi:hypothetical protein
MNQQTKLRIRKDCQEFWKKSSKLSEAKLHRFIISQVRKGQKEIMSDAIKIFVDAKPENTIFTKNPIILELRGVRGDYEH